MGRFHLTPAAARDLAEIHEFIAGDNWTAATELVRRLRDRCRFLANTPEGGRRRDELEPGLRYFPVGNYLIFYRVADDGIQVIRFLHGARDIRSAFDDE